MPQNWKTYKLGDVSQIGSSKRIFRADYVEEGIPFYRSKEIIQKAFNESLVDPLFISKEKYFDIKNLFGSPQDGDILISAVGNRSGIPYLVIDDGEFYFKDGNLIWFSKFKNNLDSSFLVYWLKSRTGQHAIESVMIGSAQKALTIEGVKSIEVTVPEPIEQTAIASILSALDDKIELNLQQNKTLEEMAMALYKHWFVDFGPFKDGKFIESELGRIPESYEVKSIYHLVDVIYGAPFKSKLFNEKGKGFPLIRIRDLKLGKPNFYTEEENPKKMLINKGDILAGMDALFTPYSWSGATGVLNQRVVFFKPKGTEVKRRYVFEAIKPWLSFFEGAKVGTTVIHLSKSDIDQFKFVYPVDSKVLVDVNEKLENIHNRIVNNNLEIDSLTELRDTLLPKLISGEIRVKDLENNFKEVL